MSMPRASVLLVDDDPLVRDSVARILDWEGYEVACAADGAAAVALARGRRFDVAITDLVMPGMTGMETLAALKGLDGDLVVIVVTGHATLETAIGCLRQGAWDYLQKPYHPEELKVLLERALEHRELQGAVSLYEASQVLLTSFSTEELRERVLEMAARVLRAPTTVLLLDRGEDDGYEVHARGPSRELAGGLARRLFLPGLADHDAHAGLVQSDAEPVFEQYVGYPLAVRQRSLGVLVGLRPPRHPRFTWVEQRRGAIFAAQSALALDNARIYATLEALSVIDELTGLHSRRYLFDTVRRTAHQRHDDWTSFLMIDVDHFKRVNDRFGHVVGDRVLRRVAELLLTATRDTDVVARVGGEEFAVLLPGTDAATAKDVAERVRATIAQHTSDPPVTVSVGVASIVGTLVSDTDDPLARAVLLMERADLALYRAKASGRNKVCAWTGKERTTPDVQV
ncbi:MAG: diguanylate cyclase [Myxococcota bacterium]